MNKQRVILIVLAVLVVLSLGGASYVLVVNKQNVAKFQLQLKRLTANIQELQTNNTELEQAMQVLTDEKMTLEERVDIARGDLTDVRAELSTMSTKVESAEQRAGALAQERDTLLRETTTLTKQKDALERKLTTLRASLTKQQDQVQQLEEQLADVTAERDTWQSDASMMTDGMPPTRSGGPQYLRLDPTSPSAGAPEAGAVMVDTATEDVSSQGQMVMLPPIIVHPDAQTTPAANVHGKVISVNRDHAFIVVDLGVVDGMQIGQLLSVHRGKHQVGVIRVIRVRQSVSACDVESLERKRFNVRQGDLVIVMGDEV